jgi:hypothetical protein
METYHFGVPEWVVWFSHIVMGAFFVYVGYALVLRQKLPTYVAITVLVLGVLAILYHGHIWILDATSSSHKTHGEAQA